MRYERKLHHLSEFKDSDFKTLSNCNIRHKIFLEADREQTTLIHRSMYCLLQLCHHKYTDTKTWACCTFFFFFVITLSRILSPVLFSLKINNIVKSVLKSSEASLFVDDFALCISAKFLPHAQRLLQLCVNSVQDWVSNNGFKFSTSKTVCMHFCYQRKHFEEPFILLDKNPTCSCENAGITTCS